MDNSLKFSTTIDIHATADVVWDTITNPELVKKYFFNTEIETSWQPGSPIFWRGEWDGKAYEEKGEILDIDPGNSISMSYLSSMLEDNPENYSVLNYSIETTDDEFSKLTLEQVGFVNEEALGHSKQNWEQVLDGLRKVAEEENE
ncbi:SRPBCC family protein [Flavobacterium silvaticum]|uniref:SRPBCC domain-containing protein n=1 Tax=Flavobacterium silvaticum TaxID=1852020 RepID=A0A972JIF3_9FLAO|nr:SRPBCC family protein [Flavobacterium silvaticum]NMH28168.1 SRPBCC domain-containing protein [Flavobacterium silvaticum]